eukprot:NODE_205_length_3401_cov_6.181124.p1 GENE.NODE_205_length_3401_cov_6.181124~~NODE_205_length_3401_cov_6.181124.p1  ORF type:complete len:857 (-),score=190.47 NODE_205_length_3401_cov_6.181124:831-3320(-)
MAPDVEPDLVTDDGTLMLVRMGTDHPRVHKLLRLLDDEIPKANTALRSAASLGTGAKNRNPQLVQRELGRILAVVRQHLEGLDGVDVGTNEQAQEARASLIDFTHGMQERLASAKAIAEATARRDDASDATGRNARSRRSPSPGKKATELINGLTGGQTLTLAGLAAPIIVKYQGRGERPSPSDNLYVKGLPGSVTEEDLETIFSTVGSIQSMKVTAADWGAIAFIRMKDRSETSAAIARFNGIQPAPLTKIKQAPPPATAPAPTLAPVGSETFIRFDEDIAPFAPAAGEAFVRFDGRAAADTAAATGTSAALVAAVGDTFVRFDGSAVPTTGEADGQVAPDSGSEGLTAKQRERLARVRNMLAKQSDEAPEEPSGGAASARTASKDDRPSQTPSAAGTLGGVGGGSNGGGGGGDGQVQPVTVLVSLDQRPFGFTTVWNTEEGALVIDCVTDPSKAGGVRRGLVLKMFNFASVAGQAEATLVSWMRDAPLPISLVFEGSAEHANGAGAPDRPTLPNDGTAKGTPAVSTVAGSAGKPVHASSGADALPCTASSVGGRTTRGAVTVSTAGGGAAMESGAASLPWPTGPDGASAGATTNHLLCVAGDASPAWPIGLGSAGAGAPATSAGSPAAMDTGATNLPCPGDLGGGGASVTKRRASPAWPAGLNAASAGVPAADPATAATPLWPTGLGGGEVGIDPVERRIDQADGNAYTLEDFAMQYGGSTSNPPAEWLASKPTAPPVVQPPENPAGAADVGSASADVGAAAGDDGVEDGRATKKRKKLAGKVERRVDPSDGSAYTLEEFVQEYGGSVEEPPAVWASQSHTSFMFKS